MKICHATIQFDWVNFLMNLIQAYGQRRSLILNVLTKWGTLIKFLTSILKNQQALLNYFQQKKPGIDQSKKNPLINIVNDYSFWKRLTIVKKVLNLIHKIQYMFETEGHKLYTIAFN